jgi:hypothetical protein
MAGNFVRRPSRSALVTPLAVSITTFAAAILSACGPSRFMLCVFDSAGQVYTRTYEERLALDSKLSGAMSLRDEAAEASAAHDIPCPSANIRLVHAKKVRTGRETTLEGCGATVSYVEVCKDTETGDAALRTCGERLIERSGLPGPPGNAGSNSRKETQM